MAEVSLSTKDSVRSDADKGGDEVTVIATDVEAAAVEDTYSKTSVTYMILFSTLALGSDGYNASIVSNLSLLFFVIYPELSKSMYTRLSNSFLIGMVVGMLLFGYTVDHMGRKRGAVLTTLILVVGIVLSAAASGTSQNGMFWMLVVARGIAGVGAGGEYPVSGAGAIEATDENKSTRKHRGFIFAMMSDVAATGGFIFGSLVPLLLLLCFKQDVNDYHIIWRLAIALGLIPPISIFWFRYRMAVSSAYRKSAAKKDRIPLKPIFKRYRKNMIGCCFGFFMYNFITYPFGLFASLIITQLEIGDSLVKNLGWGVVLTLFYAPGAAVGGWLSDKIGRKQTFCLGFVLQGCVGFILGGTLKQIVKSTPAFIIVYGLFLSLGELGPGATILTLSSECFPTSIRGQCLGFICAWGKAGAAVGTSVFSTILFNFGGSATKGNQAVFLIGSGFAILGAIGGWFMLTNNDPHLDNEDEEWKAYLSRHGYEIQWGDHETVDPAGLKMNAVRS